MENPHYMLALETDKVGQGESGKPLAILTNGAKFIDETVRNWLSELDVVKVSTDACDERTFRVINRPHRDVKFEAFIDGIENLEKCSMVKYGVKLCLCTV
jgi:Fe-S oxidoreductases